MNREPIRYWHEKKMEVVGAGSFGSPAAGRLGVTPRLYNLMEIQPDFGVVRVHTRKRDWGEGPWEGW